MDLFLFERLGAGNAARPAALTVAIGSSRWSWLPMLALVLPLALGSSQDLTTVIACLLLAGAVQLSAKRLARQWQVQRPFTQGLSPNHLGHSLRPGFPSTHAVVMGFVTAFLALGPTDALTAASLVLLSAVTGWARVYAGAHFPSDVLAGWTLGGLTGVFAWKWMEWLGLLPV